MWLEVFLPEVLPLIEPSWSKIGLVSSPQLPVKIGVTLSPFPPQISAFEFRGVAVLTNFVMTPAFALTGSYDVIQPTIDHVGTVCDIEAIVAQFKDQVDAFNAERRLLAATGR